MAFHVEAIEVWIAKLSEGVAVSGLTSTELRVFSDSTQFQQDFTVRTTLQLS